MKKEEIKGHRSLRQRVSERCRQPMEAFEHLVVWRGQTNVTVYGCRRILLYTPRRICLLVGKRPLSVLGQGLICSAFCAGAVTVRGEIRGVEYAEGTEDGA